MVNLNQQITEAVYMIKTTETVNLINILTIAFRILAESEAWLKDFAAKKE